MRFELRLAVVVIVVAGLAAGLWPDSEKAPRSNLRSATRAPKSTPADPPATATAPPRMAAIGTGDSYSVAAAAAPEDDPAAAMPETDALGREQPRALPRRHDYDAVLIASNLAPGSLDRNAVRRFWIEAADRGAPDEAIDALEQIARANADRPELAHAALDQRDDLLALRAARERTAERDAYPAFEDPDFPELARQPDLAPDGDPANDSTAGAYVFDDVTFDEIVDTLRYASDPRDVSDAIGALALERNTDASDALLLAVDHPGTTQRSDALTALWRAAADGQADVDRVRAALERARYDRHAPISTLAETALADLDRPAAGEPDGGVLFDPGPPEAMAEGI